MDKEKFIEKIKEAGTSEDMTIVRSILAEIQDEVSHIYDTNTELTESNKKYESDNETLRKANMDLFLRVGSSKDDSKVQENNTGIHQEPPKEYKSYDELAKDFM